MEEYTNGELRLLFQRIEEKLDDIKTSMNTQHVRFEGEILDIRDDLKAIEKKQEETDQRVTKLATIGSTIWAAITLFGGFLLNKFFAS